MTADPKVIHKYAAGYSQCANEVTRYLTKMEGFNPEVKNRLANHLSNSLNKLNTASMPPSVGSPASSPLPIQLGQGQQPLGLQMTANGGIVIPQSQAGDLQIGQLASAVMSSMAQNAAASNAAAVSSSGNPGVVNGAQQPMAQVQLQSPVQQQQQQQQQSLFSGALHPAAAALMAGSASLSQGVQQQQQQQGNPPQLQAPTAQAQQPQGVPVLQLIPAKLPSGELVFLMTNQAMPVTNVMNPMSIQIPGAASSASASATPTPNSLVSPIPAAQGSCTPAVLPVSIAANPALGFQGLAPLSSSSTPSSTSVAVVPPQIQDPKPSTSSSFAPDSPTEPYKSKPMFPMFSSFPQDKPLDLGPSTSGLNLKQERSPTSSFFGAKPKSTSAATSTVTSCSSMAIDLTDKKSDSEKSSSREEFPLQQPQGHHQGHGHGQGQEAAPQAAAAAAAGPANQGPLFPQGHFLNLPHDSMWRPWWEYG